MMRSGSLVVLPVLICVLYVQNSRAQSRMSPLSFEAASVKTTERCSMADSVTPGRIALHGDPLKVVLMEAFNVKTDQIVGPSWLDTDCFEVMAKMPEGATSDQLPEMFQALLVQKFKLAAHREVRLSQGYALVVGKDGPKLTPSESVLNAANVHAGNTLFRSSLGTAGIKGSMTMAALARYLSGRGYGPVEDSTGLKGKYDIDLSWAPDRAFEPVGGFVKAGAAAAQPNADVPPAPAADLFAALQDSLGLRLEPRKEPVEVVVIDHIERVPADN